MARQARLASRDPAPVLADGRTGTSSRSGCVAGGVLALPSSPAQGRHRPAARQAGLNRLGSPVLPVETSGLVTALTPLDPRNWQILVHLGRNKKLSAA